MGSNAIKAIPVNAKNFILTPASQATVKPPAAINNAVPRSGCVATKIRGAIKTTTGKTYFHLSPKYFFLTTIVSTSVSVFF